MAPLTEQQIENTKVAYSIMAGFPAHKVRLGSYRYSIFGMDELTNEYLLLRSCETSGCIAGVLSAHPYFIERGLRWGSGLSPRFNGKPGGMALASYALFGANLFYAGDTGVEGKKEALRRLRRHLYENDVITKKRNDELRREEERITS